MFRLSVIPFISSVMGVFMILIFLTTLADKFSVDARGIDVHIIFDHQETFEVRDDREVDWNRARRSLDDYEVQRSRKLTWSANSLAGNDMEEDTNKGEKDKKSKDYEVVDLTGGKAGLLNEPWLKKIRSMALVPACGVAVLLLVLCYYHVCLRKKGCGCLCDIFPCLSCLSPKKVARKGVNKYMPGVIIDEEEGTAEYYEITEAEREALYDVGGQLA